MLVCTLKPETLQTDPRFQDPEGQQPITIESVASALKNHSAKGVLCAAVSFSVYGVNSRDLKFCEQYFYAPAMIPNTVATNIYWRNITKNTLF